MASILRNEFNWDELVDPWLDRLDSIFDAMVNNRIRQGIRQGSVERFDRVDRERGERQ